MLETGGEGPGSRVPAAVHHVGESELPSQAGHVAGRLKSLIQIIFILDFPC